MEDTRIHQREILITLDYLLHHTDEDHPARAVEICRYANKEYGITYQGEGVSGNQIKRQRVSECLKYLKELSDKYDFPFVLAHAGGGKFYIEERNGLSDEQTARLLVAIYNDPYIGKEGTEFYEGRILDAFATTKASKEAIKKLSSLYLQGGDKQSEEVIQKIEILEKAYRDNCPIKVQWPGEKYPEWTKVCYLKEVHHDPCAFLLPACSLPIQGSKGRYLFDKIENIVLPSTNYNQLACSDKKEIEEYADNEKVFRLSNPKLAKRYGCLDRMLKKTIPSLGEKDGVVSFYFKDVDEKVISKSFESFFGEKFHCQNVDNASLFLGRESDLDRRKMSFIIRKKESLSNQKLVHFFADFFQFKSWLLSDPFGDGESCIGDYVEVMCPESINVDFANYYLKKMDAYYNYLTPRQRQHLLNAKRVADIVDAQKISVRMRMAIPLISRFAVPNVAESYFLRGRTSPAYVLTAETCYMTARRALKSKTKIKI